MNLVIEAPLSVCFDKQGNPKGRKIEKSGTKTRYWYNGLGCAVMVATMYLIRAIYKAEPRVPIRLFEGFVSFKDSAAQSNHSHDACLLKEAVCDPGSRAIYDRNDLKTDPEDTLLSAFSVAGLDCKIIPAVIKPTRQPQKSR